MKRWRKFCLSNLRKGNYDHYQISDIAEYRKYNLISEFMGNGLGLDYKLEISIHQIITVTTQDQGGPALTQFV